MRKWVTMAGFLFPLIVVILSDVLGLERKYYHHFGDYCGLFSLGLGWLEGVPYVNFPWPLWGLGQFSALAIAIVGIPSESLFAFNLAWVGLNVFSAIIAAWITARLLEVEKVPAWASLILGSVVFTMPMVSTGWIHSNPYFVLIVLSGPVMMVVLRRLLNFEAQKRLCRYEQIALLALGYIIANNFAAGIIVIGLVLVALIIKPLRILSGKGNPENPVKRQSVDGVFVLVGSLSIVSLAGYFQPTNFKVFQIAMLWILFSIGLLYLVRKKFFSFAEKEIVIWIMLGWLTGANILIFQFGRAAKIAMGTASAPTTHQLFAPWPRVNWVELGSGTHWFMFVVGAYAVSAFFFVNGLVRIKSVSAPMLIGGSVFMLAVLYLNGLIAQIPFIFPIGHSDLAFGITGRYLWVSAAAVYVAMVLFFICCRNKMALIIFGMVSLVGVAFAFNQSLQSKAAIVTAINRDCRILDALIDNHLTQSPKNLVLVANAMFPNRATILYAYHNSRTGIGHLKLESLHADRIRYIGRYGGAMWRPPYAIIKENKLSADNILIIAEMAQYPDEMRVVQVLQNTRTYVIRPTPSPFGSSF